MKGWKSLSSSLGNSMLSFEIGGVEENAFSSSWDNDDNSRRADGKAGLDTSYSSTTEEESWDLNESSSDLSSGPSVTETNPESERSISTVLSEISRRDSALNRKSTQDSRGGSLLASTSDPNVFSQSTFGQVSYPTESELLEDTWGYGEPFSSYMLRLYSMVDPRLKALETHLTASGHEDEVLSSDSGSDRPGAGEELESLWGWEAIARLPDPWAEARHPTPQLIRREEIEVTVPKSSELDIMTIASGIGNLDLPPGHDQFACTKLQLHNLGIKSIKILSKYRFLQYIDLMDNKIEDLSPVWSIPHLVVLDASWNGLTTEGVGTPAGPLFLTYLNLSHNRLAEVPDLSGCWALEHLNLSSNRIVETRNLENLTYLQYLNLSNNKIVSVDNIVNEQLKDLDLSNNLIESWSCSVTDAMKKLEILDLSRNKLVTLHMLKDIRTLKKFNISDNYIANMVEFIHLKSYVSLRELSMVGNPLNTGISKVRNLIIYNNPNIQILNGVAVHTMERANTMRLFLLDNNEMRCQQAAAFYRRHCPNPFPEKRSNRRSAHPAIIVVVGLLGCNRSEVMVECLRKNPRKVRLVRQVSTKKKIKNTKLRKIIANQMLFKHVPQKRFYQLEAEEKLFHTFLDLGYKYGIRCSDMEYVDQVILTKMTCSAAEELLRQGQNVTLVLMVPSSEELLKRNAGITYDASENYKSDFHTRLVEKTSFGRILGQIQKKHRKCSFPMQLRSQAAWSKLRKHEILLSDESMGILRGRKRRKLCKHRTFSQSTIGEEIDPCLRFSNRQHSCVDLLNTERERFIENILKNRENYLKEHVENPGLFTLYIPSDSIPFAVKKLNEVINETYERMMKTKKESANHILFSDDPLFEDMVMPDIREYVDEIRTNRIPPGLSH